MEIVDLLATFSDPSTIKSLTASQRLMAGLVTTLLGMGITFVALVVLLFITSLFDKLSALEKTQSESPQRTAPTAKKKGHQTRTEERRGARFGNNSSHCNNTQHASKRYHSQEHSEDRRLDARMEQGGYC